MPYPDPNPNRIPGAQPNSHCLNAAVAACAATPELGWKKALQLLVSSPLLISPGPSPNPSPDPCADPPQVNAPSGATDVHVFTSALSACSRAGRWREATAL